MRSVIARICLFHVKHGSHLSSNVSRETYIICCADYNN
nr:MAG TPA: hypothetical protein [Bacteriophage sp.]DAQ35236.1 MAG TPA: hypothetical protein [Caudoviricetes sp.]